MAALEAAQKRLDAAKVNKVNLEAAIDALAAAQNKVDKTEKALEEASKAADEAEKKADEALAESNTKIVRAKFSVLNRTLVQPDEVFSYTSENYSTSIWGELYSGALNQETGERDASYIALYKEGIKDEAIISQYIALAPTAEQLAEVGVVLEDYEYITWYVIKTEADGYHVDGIIKGEPAVVEPAPVDPTPVNPTPVDPKPVEPTPVEPVVDPTPVEPVVEEPVVEEPVVEEPVVEEPVVEEPVVEEPVVEEPVVEEPVVEEPVVEEPVVEEPTVVIEDEPAATTSTIPGDETVVIEDEEVARAAKIDEENCWIHWLILALMAAYTTYEIARCVVRNKKIKALSAVSAVKNIEA